MTTYKDQQQGTGTLTYTTTQTYTKMYITASWTEDQENYHGNEGARIVIQVGSTQVLNRSIAKNESGSATAVVNNVSSGTVITTTITAPTYGANAGATWNHTIRGTISYSATQNGIIRPLIATEEKAIGQQTTGMSYGRKEDGTWYGEFDGTLHNTATTGSITPGNCIGFKVITDANGEQFKIPVYGV